MSKFIIGIIITLLLVVVAIPQTAYADSGDYNDATNPQFGGEYTNEETSLNTLGEGDESVYGMYHTLRNVGWAEKYHGSFIYGVWDAWEEDFKKSSLGGTDYIYADNVDLAWFQGHGGPGKLQFARKDRDDAFLTYADAQWGDKDLEWIMFDACSTMTFNVLDGWHRSMDGLHLICGTATTITDQPDGIFVGAYLVDWDGYGPWHAQNVADAWFHGMDIKQHDGVLLRVLAEDWLFRYEYVWGQGYTFPDAQHDSTWYSYTYCC